LNGWPATGTDAPQPRPFCRIFLNGGAKHTLKVSQFADFKKAFGDGIAIKQLERPWRHAILKWVAVAVVVVAIVAVAPCLAALR
jgi:hypothetical protein